MTILHIILFMMKSSKERPCDEVKTGLLLTLSSATRQLVQLRSSYSCSHSVSRLHCGNGGRGGDVILECSPAVWDLSGLQHHINKKRDGNGPSKNMIGSRGADKPFVSFLVLVINIINLLQYWNFHLDRSMEENISVQWICENLFGKLCMEHYFFRSLAHLHIS
nr:uncharacterized protein LOC104086824 isoform X1 [Nicotiana tomentosiformis]